jgi:hypothetical protein
MTSGGRAMVAASRVPLLVVGLLAVAMLYFWFAGHQAKATDKTQEGIKWTLVLINPATGSMTAISGYSKFETCNNDGKFMIERFRGMNAPALSFQCLGQD